MSINPLPYILLALALLLAGLADFGPSDAEAEQATAAATQDAITQAQTEHRAQQAQRLASAHGMSVIGGE